MAPQISFGQFKLLLKQRGQSDEQINRAWKTYSNTGDMASVLGRIEGRPGAPVSGGFSLGVAEKSPIGAQGFGGGAIAAPQGVATAGQSNQFLSGNARPVGSNALLGGGIKLPANPPSASMPGEHSGSRIQDDRQPRITNGTPGARRLGARVNSPVDPMAAALENVLAALNSSGQQQGAGASAGYRDFSRQANQMADSIFAPEFAALSDAESRAQRNYGVNDKIVAGLYDNLRANILAQQGVTQQTYAGLGAGNTANTEQLVGAIDNTYDKANTGDAAVAAQLGLESALPTTSGAINADNAWQQGQARLMGGAQGNYLGNIGQNQINFQGNTAQAVGSQGVASREGLIRSLQAQLGELQNQRAGLQSQRARSVLDYNTQLSDRDYSSQRDAIGNSQNAQQRAIENMLTGYGLMQDRDSTNWDRAYKTEDLRLRSQPETVAPEYSDMGAAAQKMSQTYPNGAAYLNIAAQVANAGPKLANGQPNPAMASSADFYRRVSDAANQAGLNNPAAIYEAAQLFSKGLNFKSMGM